MQAKRSVALLIAIFFLLSLTLSTASPLYQQDSLEIALSINGGFTLVKTKASGSVKDVTTELLLVPRNDLRQTQKMLETTGVLEDDKIVFEWDNPAITSHEFSYESIVTTSNAQVGVSTKLPFPIPKSQLSGLEQYLEATKTIDSENPNIIARATKLVEGEDDLFKAVFALAEWVDSNVNYDLNTLTEKASQKASWVLENKQGVCDEMTSLFIAMARSVGIPARFVTGISYSSSELFSEPWQPHGWAEVYFPSVGWVSFDITFGEYGYVDPSHIKLRDGFDPSEATTKYQWFANNVELESKELEFEVKILNQGSFVPQAIQLEQEILSKEVGFGSYNLIKGLLTNTANHYAATTLRLAVPEEIEILNANRRTILLAPKETKETFWAVKVPQDLDPLYTYTFPMLLYTEKNISIQDSFTVQKGKTQYSENEIDLLTIKDDDKTYSQQIQFECQDDLEVDLGEELIVPCFIKNIGNMNLQDVNFCVGKDCKIIDLPINQEASVSTTIKGNEVGWEKIVLSAKNEMIEKKGSAEFLVADDPGINIQIVAPEVLSLNEPIQLSIFLEQESFISPNNVKVFLEGPNFRNEWEIATLLGKQELPITLSSVPISSENTFSVVVTWENEEEEKFTTAKTIKIEGKAEGIGGKIKLFLNGILNRFR